MKRRPVPSADDCRSLLADRKILGEHEFARRVFECLCDDQAREILFAALRREGGSLELQSLVVADIDNAREKAGAEITGRVYLLASEDLVGRAYVDRLAFTNAPYAALGGGQFLLALDQTEDADTALHSKQREALREAFGMLGPRLSQIARWASRAAQRSLLGRDEFDLAELAEQAALRYGQVIFGLPAVDLPVLAQEMRLVYRAMTHQMFARHFVAEPAAVPAGKAAMARLVMRCGQLMKDHALGDTDWPAGLERADDGLPRFDPVLKTLALTAGPGLHGTHRAGIVVGALAGMIGNIQAGACIAVRHLLDHSVDWDRARRRLNEAEKTANQQKHDVDDKKTLWEAFIRPALIANPPAPFLPRRSLQQIGNIPADEDCILCVGSAAADASDVATKEALLFGLDEGAKGLHWCLGAELARVMISRIVGDMLRLPSLGEQLDTRDGRPKGLTKRWGYACERFPLRHRRDLLNVQQPLNAAFRVRHPVARHAQELRAIIRHGAARIDHVLRESRHVHFAWFQFIDGDNVLVLHTVFDGNMAAYLDHFALAIDDLFDTLFEHLEGGPPLPVADHPEEFVAAILAHHHRAAEDFFFSAYPGLSTPQVIRRGIS